MGNQLTQRIARPCLRPIRLETDVAEVVHPANKASWSALLAKKDATGSCLVVDGKEYEAAGPIRVEHRDGQWTEAETPMGDLYTTILFSPRHDVVPNAAMATCVHNSVPGYGQCPSFSMATLEQQMFERRSATNPSVALVLTCRPSPLSQLRVQVPLKSVQPWRPAA